MWWRSARYRQPINNCTAESALMWARHHAAGTRITGVNLNIVHNRDYLCLVSWWPHLPGLWECKHRRQSNVITVANFWHWFFLAVFHSMLPVFDSIKNIWMVMVWSITLPPLLRRPCHMSWWWVVATAEHIFAAVMSFPFNDLKQTRRGHAAPSQAAPSLNTGVLFVHTGPTGCWHPGYCTLGICGDLFLNVGCRHHCGGLDCRL